MKRYIDVLLHYQGKPYSGMELFKQGEYVKYDEANKLLIEAYGHISQMRDYHPQALVNKAETYLKEHN